jgi:dTDP-D-glucose 4,6-dehydratase
VRYFISDEKLRALGWSQTVSFEEGITKTSMIAICHYYLHANSVVEWYRNCNLIETWGEEVEEFTLRAHPRVPSGVLHGK